MRKIFRFLIVISLLVLSNCSNPKEKHLEDKTKIIELKDVTISIESKGKKVYLHYCRLCHGETGEGDGLNAYSLDPRPRNFTDGKYMNSLPDEKLFKVITEGGNAVGKSKSMPPWGRVLTKEKVEYLIAYIRMYSSSKEE